jgi:HEAT repeat protein
VPPDDALIFVHMDRLSQFIMALIQVIGHSREYLLELAQSGSLWMRRSVARAIAEAKEVTLMHVLREYTSDPHPEVRATAYDALGRMNWAGPEAAAILVGALAAEKDELAVEAIAGALTELGDRAAVPKLIEVVDHPDYPVARRIMDALRKLTRARGPQTPAEWRAWWERHRADWEKRK